LSALAAAQHGFFTASQARKLGYGPGMSTYHVRAGNWIRVARGIYRLRNWPLPPQPLLDLALWWTADRSGKVQGALSHETAYLLWQGRPDLIRTVHVTVPRRFRRNSPPPPGVEIHREDLEPTAITTHMGYRVVAAGKLRDRMAAVPDGSSPVPASVPEADTGTTRPVPERTVPQDDYDRMIEQGMD